MDIVNLVESLFTNFSDIWVSIVKYFSSNGDVLHALTSAVSKLLSNFTGIFDVISDLVNKVL